MSIISEHKRATRQELDDYQVAISNLRSKGYLRSSDVFWWRRPWEVFIPTLKKLYPEQDHLWLVPDPVEIDNTDTTYTRSGDVKLVAGRWLCPRLAAVHYVYGRHTNNSYNMTYQLVEAYLREDFDQFDCILGGFDLITERE